MKELKNKKEEVMKIYTNTRELYKKYSEKSKYVWTSREIEEIEKKSEFMANVVIVVFFFGMLILGGLFGYFLWPIVNFGPIPWFTAVLMGFIASFFIDRIHGYVKKHYREQLYRKRYGSGIEPWEINRAVELRNYYKCKMNLIKNCIMYIVERSDELINSLNIFIQDGKIINIRNFLDNIDYQAKKCPWRCSDSLKDPEWGYANILDIVSRIWDAIYYNDIDKLKLLTNELRSKLTDKYFRNKLTKELPVKTDFYLRLIEFHYLLAELIVREYEEARSVSISSGLSVAQTSASIALGDTDVKRTWDNVLFEGSCSFKFGGISQWRDGVIRVTGAGVELEGKLRVRSLNLTALAVKAAARAAGVGEVSERIPYSSISSYDYDSKKVVIHASGKKYVIKTPAASRIGSLLDKLVRG